MFLCAMAIDCFLYNTIAFFRCPDKSYGTVTETSASIYTPVALLFHDIFAWFDVQFVVYMELCYSVIL